MSNEKQDNQKRQIAAAMRRLQRMQVSLCFDPIDLDSRPTEAQQEVFDGLMQYKHRYVRSGNQTGKSQIGAREVSWFFEENHPTWTRPADWANEPLVILVVGRVSKQVEEVLWRKIKGFLDPANFREVRSGGALQKAVNLKNGNTIIFGSHHSDNEAREKLQAYVAHFVWVDEMPGSVGLMEELHRRVQSRNGYFLATFTPKVRNEELKKFIDAQKAPLSKVYRLKMLDNPIYQGREQSLIDSLSGLTEAYRNSILYGDWLTDDNTVYQFNSDTMVVDKLPQNYGPHWRHVEGVDPALKSKFGMILLAEDPATYKWYVVRADYVQGIFVPTDMVNHIIRQLSGYNIVRRMSDPHEPWYIEQANSMGVKPVYQGVYDKHNRKGQLMKSLQEALGTRLYICSWCVDLIDEFQSMRWADGDNERIVNSSSFHLIDALQYGLDGLPKAEKIFLSQDPVQLLRDAHEKRISQEIIQAEQPQRKHWKTFRVTTAKRSVWN